jgi:hypothetical protein
MFTLILGLESIGEAATMMIFYCFLRGNILGCLKTKIILSFECFKGKTSD